MVLASVVGASHADVEWVTRAMGRVFPQQWEQFRDALPEAEHDGNLAAAYSRLLQTLTLLSTSRPPQHGAHGRTLTSPLFPATGTIPATTTRGSASASPAWSRTIGAMRCSSRNGALFHDAHLLAGIPVVMVNGQLDISGPLEAAWSLTKVMPDAELIVIGDEGHGGAQSMFAAVVSDDRPVRPLIVPGRRRVHRSSTAR